MRNSSDKKDRDRREGAESLAENICERYTVRTLKDICHCRRGTAITGGNPGQVTEDGGDI